MKETQTPATHPADEQFTPSRRTFLRGSAAVVGAALAYSAVPAVHAGASDELKVGLIGCGGRGSGAAVNALHGDQYAKIVALGDMFKDKLDAAYTNLKASDVGDRIQVADEHKFTGWDAYKNVIAMCDVVLLATPPFFRPIHLKAAIEGGKHVFCEKPVATDATALRDVMATAKLAKEKGLNLVSGLCYRYDAPKVEMIKRIHDGAIGRILCMQSNYMGGGLWSNQRKPEWSDMEYQLRNWLYYTWLSGDHIAEQHIHSLDKCMWVMGDEAPATVFASGGRTVRTQPVFGNVYDHFNTTYEWANGVKLFSGSRQYPMPEDSKAAFFSDVSDHIFGTEGIAHLQAHQITDKDGKMMFKISKDEARSMYVYIDYDKDGKIISKVEKPKVSMYDAEHVALFNAIRTGKPINNGDYMCSSTLAAIAGRTAAYTGRQIPWTDMLASQEDLRPANMAFGELAMPEVAVPGIYKFR